MPCPTRQAASAIVPLPELDAERLHGLCPGTFGAQRHADALFPVDDGQLQLQPGERGEKCWSQPGDDTRYARFTANDTDWGNRNYGRTSDIFVEKADYLCLRDVSLSWSLPKAWLRKLHISDVTLTVSGNTLCYWTAVHGSRPRPRPPAASTPRRRPTTPGSVPTRRRAKCSSRPNSRSDTLLP